MDLDSIIAEWYLGLYPPEKMPTLAVWALEHGYDRPALRDLAGRASATRASEEELIERSCREMGKQPLALYDAGKGLANLVCQQIVSGKTSPGNGAARIWLIYDRCGCPRSLIPFVGAEDEWESDLDHRDHYEELIRKAAMKFLQESPSLQPH